MRNQDPHNNNALDRLLAEVPAQEREALREAWSLSGDAAAVAPDVREASWNVIVRRTHAPTQPFLRPMPRLRLAVLFPRMAAVAAAVVLFVGLGYFSRPTDSVFRAPAGTLAVVQMPDGTQVELAPGSELRVDEEYGRGEREVALSGEAFFDVASAESNGGVAFRIETFNALVEVVGTAFNVRARENELDASTRVAVEHGVVKVAQSDQALLPVVLETGQGTEITGDSRPSPAQPVLLERALAWRTGGLAFDEMPMGDVFKEIERRFETKIDAPEAIRRIEVSYWRETSIEVSQILADLADVVGAEVRPTAQGFELFQAER